MARSVKHLSYKRVVHAWHLTYKTEVMNLWTWVQSPKHTGQCWAWWDRLLNAQSGKPRQEPGAHRPLGLALSVSSRPERDAVLKEMRSIPDDDMFGYLLTLNAVMYTPPPQAYTYAPTHTHIHTWEYVIIKYSVLWHHNDCNALTYWQWLRDSTSKGCLPNFLILDCRTM